MDPCSKEFHVEGTPSSAPLASIRQPLPQGKSKALNEQVELVAQQALTGAASVTKEAVAQLSSKKITPLHKSERALADIFQIRMPGVRDVAKAFLILIPVIGWIAFAVLDKRETKHVRKLAAFFQKDPQSTDIAQQLKQVDSWIDKLGSNYKVPLRYNKIALLLRKGDESCREMVQKEWKLLRSEMDGTIDRYTVTRLDAEIAYSLGDYKTACDHYSKLHKGKYGFNSEVFLRQFEIFQEAVNAGENVDDYLKVLEEITSKRSIAGGLVVSHFADELLWTAVQFDLTHNQAKGSDFIGKCVRLLESYAYNSDKNNYSYSCTNRPRVEYINQYLKNALES